MKILRKSTLTTTSQRVADKFTRYKLGTLAESMHIPWKELVTIVYEAQGVVVEDCCQLTEAENKKLQKYMKVNERALIERYVIWRRRNLIKGK